MKRSLTVREWVLLGLLAVVAVISGYVMLFYMPVTAQRDAAREETELCRLQIEASQLRLSEKRRMERELEELFAREKSPRSLAAYDNLQPVMLELHTILAEARDYSLSFGTVDASRSIVRREISVSFTCDSYDAAKTVLRRLDESLYRCMLNDITISLGQTAEGFAAVSGSVVFFEYQAQSHDSELS